MFKYFTEPDILSIKKKELTQAILELGSAKSGVEYATALVEYNTKRVERLKKEVAEFKEIDDEKHQSTFYSTMKVV